MSWFYTQNCGIILFQKCIVFTICLNIGIINTMTV
jgi:hypothetical protein